MLTRIVAMCLGLASLLQAQLVEKVNGPLAGNVSRFTWTPDGRYILYGAARDSSDIDVVTSVRVADRSEAVFDPYPDLVGSARTMEFVFLPDRELVGARISFIDWSNFPPYTGEPLHILDRASALQVSTGGEDPRFLDDGRMLFRTVFHAYHGSTYERGWTSRWDVASTALEMSKVVAVTPFFVVWAEGNSRPSRCGGSFFMRAGFVRLECRNVPPVRSMVRVLSRVSGST